MPVEADDIKDWVTRLVRITDKGRVADLGCGQGQDLVRLAGRHPNADFVGVDQSEEWIRHARESSSLANLRFLCQDVSARLPFDDQSLDAILSINLLECISDRAAFIAECARVLRPGGCIVMAHFDWDTQTFDGPDYPLIRRLVLSFNDWKQDWMKATDPWTGRRLHGVFSADGSFSGEVVANTLISTSFEPDSYGRRQAESFRALVRRGLVSETDYTRFIEFQENAAARDAFFYSVTMFAFVGTKLG